MDLRTMVSLLLLLLLGLCAAHQGNDHGETIVDKSGTEDISTTILRMNNGSDELLLDGDVLIPRTRNAMKCLKEPRACLWPKSANGNVEIPFLISEKYDQAERNTILTAMKDFASKTCIRFIPRTTQTRHISIEPRLGCRDLTKEIKQLKAQVTVLEARVGRYKGGDRPTYKEAPGVCGDVGNPPDPS
ncbi:Low choriolytic enzyme [Collichthys lucidus]|uniref:Low choriolytic enzyme n=1 Tax=Collichthys lucidus TaxID=240159 RepID=A0A4U5TX34_COLLU|nr:Low choriolytic enzyme [Collichthys lucidus]